LAKKPKVPEIWYINIWADILGNYIIDPYFFKERLSATNYLGFLQNVLPNLLKHVDNDVLNRM